MHNFAASSHSALDERERLNGRLRRMRHEYRQEVAAFTHEFDDIHELLVAIQERHNELMRRQGADGAAGVAAGALAAEAQVRQEAEEQVV